MHWLSARAKTWSITKGDDAPVMIMGTEAGILASRKVTGSNPSAGKVTLIFSHKLHSLITRLCNGWLEIVGRSPLRFIHLFLYFYVHDVSINNQFLASNLAIHNDIKTLTSAILFLSFPDYLNKVILVNKLEKCLFSIKWKAKSPEKNLFRA